MKFIKYAAIFIFSIIALLVVGSYAAISFVDKSYLEEQISDSLDRELKINGDISPEFSLIPTAKITNLTLENAEWGSKKEMLNIGEIKAGIKLIPLLSGDVEVSKLLLKDSEILLEKKKKWNFEFADDTQEAEEKKEEAAATSISVDNIEIENLKISVKENGKASSYTINSLSLSPKGDLSELKLAMKVDGEAINLNTNITPVDRILSDKKVQLANLALNAAGYKINGDINADISKEKPYVSGKVNIGDIDLSGNEKAAQKKSTELYSKSPLPLDAFNSFDGDISIYVNSVKLDEKIKLSKISVPAKIAKGVFRANNSSAMLAGTKIKSNLKLSKSSSSVSLDMNNLKAASLFLGEDFSGGLTNLSTKLNTSGSSVHSMVNRLSGNTKLRLNNAVYSGKSKAGVLEQLFKLLTGGSASARTEINCVTTNIAWANGVGKISDLGVVTDSAIISGKGKIKLPTQKLKLTLNPSAKNIGLTDLIVPPIAISGKFDDLSAYPDPQGTAISAVKTAAGIASGVGIFAKIGEVVADKTGVSEAIGIAEKNPCDTK